MTISKEDQLHQAALDSDWDTVRTLVAAAADIKTHDNIVLRMACFHGGASDIALHALQKGADISVKDYTPYMWARSNEQKGLDTKTADAIREWAKENNIDLSGIDQRSLEAFRKEKRQALKNHFKK